MYLHGAFACVYFLAGITTFLAGLASFFTKSAGDVHDKEVTIDPLTIVLPLAVIIFDLDVRRVYLRREKYHILCGKIILWVVFYIIVGLAGQDNDSPGIPSLASHQDLVKVTGFLYLLWPALSLIYSYCLVKFPAMLSIDLPLQHGGPEGGNNDNQ